MNSPKVALIVLNHNGLHLLPACLGSLRRLRHDNLELILVDNASTDGSLDFVRRAHPEVFLIRNPLDDGFPSGMNLGIRHALDRGAEYVALLNNDTEVDPGWISEMVRVAGADPAVGAVASRMMFMDNRRLINGIGVSMNLAAVCWDTHQGRIFRPEMERSEETYSVCGGACLFRAEALRAAGLLDRAYIHYCEDVDLCVRIRDRGYRIVTAPRAFIYHKFCATLGQGSPQKTYFALRARLYLILKFYPPDRLAPVLAIVWHDALRDLVRFVAGRRWALARAQARALLSSLLLVRRAAAFRRANRGRFGPAVLAGVRRDLAVDCLPPYEIDYRLPAEGERPPSRILVGVNDTVLGDGWHRREGGCLRSRWTTDRSECLLAARPGEPHVLQLHLRQPHRVRERCAVAVRADGAAAGTLDFPTGGWHTLHLPLRPASERVAIVIEPAEMLRPEETGERRDLGVQCNEVSLLPEGSPLIRAERVRVRLDPATGEELAGEEA
ncbi:MAG: glycosyltransferase family 2 protein [bacterium]|nr:glycosyltransferase family 2 protein [bacterium]